MLATNPTLRGAGLATMALLVLAMVPGLAPRGPAYRLAALACVPLLATWLATLVLLRRGSPSAAPLARGLALATLVASVALPLGLGPVLGRFPHPRVLGWLAALDLAQLVVVWSCRATTTTAPVFAAATAVAALPFTFLALTQVGRHPWRGSESGAIGDLRTIASSQAAYAQVNGGAFGPLECLVRPPDCVPGYSTSAPTFLEATFLEAERRGYRFALHPGRAVKGGHEALAVTAVPVVPGETGVRAFCVDVGSGEIHTVTDGVLPAGIAGSCPPSMPILR